MLHGPWLADALSQYFAGKTIKAIALTSSHEPAVGTVFRSSLTGEISGGGYVAGGVTVTGLVASWDAATTRVVVTCDLINFGSVTAADVGAVALYISTGSAATDRVLWTDTFDALAAEGALTYQPDARGAIELQL